MSLGFLHFIAGICTTLDQNVHCRSAEDFCWHIQATFDKLLAEEHSFSVLAAQSQGQRAQPLPLPSCVGICCCRSWAPGMCAGTESSHLHPTSLSCPFISTWVGNFLPILLIVKNKTSQPEAILDAGSLGMSSVRLTLSHSSAGQVRAQNSYVSHRSRFLCCCL